MRNIMQLFIPTLLLTMFLVSVVPAQAQQTPTDAFPEDVTLALSAIVSQMRGWPLGELPVTLMQGGRFQFVEPTFFYNGFELKYVELLDLKLIKDNPFHRYMQAVLHFVDAQGRLGLAQLAAEYALYENQGVNLRNVGVWPLFAPAPRFEMFVVSAQELKQAGPGVMQSYESLHTFASSRAHNSNRGEFAFLIFAKDRLAPKTSLEVILSDDQVEDDVDDSIADFSYLDFNGWPVALVQGPASLGDPGEMLYVNVFHTDAAGKRVRTAQFDSMCRQPVPQPEPFPQPSVQYQQPVPQYQQPAVQPAPQPAPQYQQPQQEEAIESGRVLLNPIFPEHVQAIQMRLMALGYYNGPIDSVFNSKTDQGLNNFAARNGLPKDQWSLSLQKTLFKGSGL